jgi:hypothetical protein
MTALFHILHLELCSIEVVRERWEVGCESIDLFNEGEDAVLFAQVAHSGLVGTEIDSRLVV